MTLQERLERRVFNPKLYHNIILPYVISIHRIEHRANTSKSGHT